MRGRRRDQHTPCFALVRLLVQAQLLQVVEAQLSGCWFSFPTSGECTSDSCNTVDQFTLSTSGDVVTCVSSIYGTSTWTQQTDANWTTSGACTVNAGLASINGTISGDDIVWSHGYTSRKQETCTSPPPPPLATCQKSVAVCNDTLRDCCATFPEAMTCAEGYTAVALNEICREELGAAYWCCSSGAAAIQNGCLGSTIAVIDAAFVQGTCDVNQCAAYEEEWCNKNCADVMIGRYFGKTSPVSDRGVVSTQWPNGNYFHMCAFYQDEAGLQLGIVVGTISFFILVAVITVAMKSST
mmetsp:Transcript_15435/g.35043  ORF Transcript_15435/g.35043 Transcript_15435/m.35043 type:complete len:297 (-) Transcript_15435:297-1187(-)